MLASRAWLSFCLLCSGACALVYEIAWLRLLALTLGNTAYATSCILSVFLGGLALGAYVAGKWVEQKRAVKLAVYGAVEVAIGLVAPVVTVLLKLSPALLVTLSQALPADNWVMRTALNAAISCLLLLLPTVLMGATLPIVIKYVQRVHKQSEWFSWLYGMNTLGAVFGSFAAAFAGFAYIGITFTTVAAGVVNILIGLASIFVSRSEPAQPEQEVLGPTESEVGSTAPSAGAEGTLNILAFVTGFAAVSYEVLWTRLLRFYTGSLTYAFSVMIGTFLLGLAAGSFYYQKRLMKLDVTDQDRFVRFANLQTLAAIACGGSLIALPAALVIKSHFPNVFPMENPWPMVAQLAVVSSVIMLLPTILVGTLFPLIGTIATANEKQSAAAVGRSYALNTIGCVLGSLVTGLILIPVIGTYRAFQLVVLISAFAALLAVIAAKAARPKLISFGIVPVVLAIGFLSFIYVPFSNFLTVLNGTVLKTGEDAIGSMMVLDFPKADTRVLLFNGSSLATTAMPSRRYMRLLGHMPALLHKQPREVMVACFGTGTTTGAIALHPQIKRVKVVELSEMVLRSGDLFSQSNHSVLQNPKLSLSVTDARNFLLLSPEKFDVITFEPPPPCDSGIVNLYTTDFYRLVRNRLRPGGIMCQWVPQHEVSSQLWKMQTKSALEVFPYVSVWLPNSGEALLLCSDTSPDYDLKRIEQGITADNAVARSLAEVGIHDGADLLATFVCDQNQLKEFVGDAKPLTDDHPSLEFFHPYLGPTLSDADLYKLSARSDKPFESDPAVRRARQALAFTFADKLEAALKLQPANNWFLWMKKAAAPEN